MSGKRINLKAKELRKRKKKRCHSRSSYPRLSVNNLTVKGVYLKIYQQVIRI